jgi:hypothetical protein
MNSIYSEKLAVGLLGSKIVPSDSHDEEGAMMTENKEWYFIPCSNDPVVNVARKSIVPSKPMIHSSKWAIEVMHKVLGGYDEPDDMMLQEVGNRSDSLVDAILEASRIDHENKICLTAEGIFWECQKLIEEENPFD